MISNDRTVVLKYFVQQYFDNDVKQVAEITGYKESQIKNWLEGKTQPQKATLKYIIHCATAPEFYIINEFFPFDNSKALQTQIKELLGNRDKCAGIYAFYDAFGNLLYVGKASTDLLKEIQDALKRTIPVEKLPNFKNIGEKDRPQIRAELVKYISAYYVGETEFSDYPKHVESLILRISKPLFNKIKGSLLYHASKPEE